MPPTRIFLLNPRIDEFDEGFVRGKRRFWPPTSLAILASILLDEGRTIELLDANALDVDDEDIHRRIARFRPDVVVYSSGPFDSWQCPSPGIEPIVQFARAAERWEGRPPLVVVGPHGTLLPDELMRAAHRVDFVVRGEPERTTAQLVEKIVEGSDAPSVSGVSSRNATGELVHAPDARLIDDLDALPNPAFRLLPLDRYCDGTAMGPRFFVTASSRGCALQCSFCNKSMFGDRMRNRSADGVVAELREAVLDHGVRRVLFHDQNFIASPRRVRELCDRLIEEDLPLTWRCQSTLFAQFSNEAHNLAACFGIQGCGRFVR